jgi:hypothetical protein
MKMINTTPQNIQTAINISANQVGSIQRGSKDAHDYLKGDEDER